MNTSPAAPAGFFLVGPTASGKSRVAQWLGERHGYVILAADSMQVYCGMDIGTAKPTGAERARVSHHGLDLATPDRPFSVSEWLAAVREAFTAAGDRPVLVVGGTGLYLRCLAEGFHARPPPDLAVRAHWEAVLAQAGVDGLREALRVRWPDVLAGLADPNNPRRLIRALEAAESGLEGIRAWRDRPAHVPFVGLRLERDLLNSRIESRVLAMYDAGLVEEARHLQEQVAALSATASQAIGYAEALDVVAGRATRAQAMARTVARTRQYAKRQRTWFQHQANVCWVDVTPDIPVEVVASSVQTLWARQGPTLARGLLP